MSWQIGPCVRLETGAHCPAWLFTELCLKFHGLTLFVFKRSTLPHFTPVAHRRLSPSSANIFSYLGYTEVTELLFIQLFFFLELKHVIVHLNISGGLKCYFCAVTICELIKRDHILLPILAHSPSPVKLSQLPLQMLSNASHQNTHHHSQKHHILGCM